MAVTKEQLEQAIKVLSAQTADATLSPAERAAKQAELTQLSVAYKSMGAAQATSPLTTAADPETTNYYADRAKVGFTNFLSRILPDSFFDISLPTEELASVAASGSLFDSKAGKEQAQRRELIRQQAVNEKANEWFGAVPRAPRTPLERYAGVAVEAVASDPIMSVIGGRGALSSLANVAQSGVAATGGAVAYDAIAGAAESLGATPEWQDRFGKGAAILGGVLAGVGAGTLQSGLETTRQARLNLERNRNIQDSLDKASDFIVSSNTQKVIDDIIAVEPNIDEHIARIKTLGDIVPDFTVAPGIALHDNAIIKKNMEVLLKESPQFRASVEASLKDLGTAVKTRQAAVFGNADDPSIYKAVVGTAGNYGVKLDAAQARIQQLDAGIDRVLGAARTTTDALSIGTAAAKLIDAKEAALRAKNSAEYERLLNKYTSEGVTFPAQSVQALHEFVGGTTAEKLFTPFPTLVNKINQYLAPKQGAEVPASLSDFLTRTGAQLSANFKPTPQYQDITLRQLDSLKQELNAAIRKSGGTTAGPALVEFKRLLDSQVQEIPGFGAQYKAVDTSFYRDLGLPFDSAGLSQLDSLKFNETVGNYLSKPERAMDFIGFVGDAGVPIVKDAILLKMRNKVFAADGTFKPDQYAKFLRENKALIDTVPNFRRELSDIGASVAKMDATKARLDGQFNQAAEKQAANFILATKNRGLNAAINDMLVNPKKLAEYADTIKNLDADSAYTVRQGVRSALINRAFKHPQGAQEFIKNNPETFSTWFGSAYAKNLDALAEANDILKAVDPSRMGFAFSYKEADALQAAIGTSLPQAGSLLRDRISAPLHKASIIFSRWFTKRTATKRDDAMADLLTNPAALDRIASTAAAYKASKIDLKEFAKNIANIMSFSVYRGGAMAEQGAEVSKATPMP